MYKLTATGTSGSRYHILWSKCYETLEDAKAFAEFTHGSRIDWQWAKGKEGVAEEALASDDLGYINYSITKE